jgi:hypothetical protein
MAAQVNPAAKAPAGVQYAPNQNLKTRVAAAATAAAAAAQPAAGAATQNVKAGLTAVSAKTEAIRNRISEFYSKYGSSFPSRERVNQGLTLFYYASLALFGLFLVLVFIHYTMYPIFSFVPGDGGIIPVPTVSDRQVFYKSTRVTSVEPIPVTDILSVGYTVSFDLFLTSELIGTHAPRVLLYRGSAKRSLTEIQDAAVLADNKRYGPYLTGLFDQSNFVLWVDPMKNDMYLGVVTQSPTDSTRKVMTISDPVQNLPIGRAFRVTLVYTQQFAEIYIDGRLKMTMAISSRPIENTGDMKLWAVPAVGTNDFSNVKMASVAYWPRTLSSREVSAEGTPITDSTVFQRL